MREVLLQTPVFVRGVHNLLAELFNRAETPLEQELVFVLFLVTFVLLLVAELGHNTLLVL